MDRKDYPTLDDAVRIPMGELSVDEQNIRSGVWGRDGDDDLIQSVKQRGIDQPVIVRPLDHDENGRVSEWGIIAGGRRYNAAIEADLDTMPCRVRDYDDTQAMLHSMEENRQRRDSATWRDIEFVGEVLNRLSSDGHTIESAKQEIMTTVGCSKPTIDRYYKVYKLPEKTRALLRGSEDLTQAQRDYYQSLSPYHPSALPLKIGTVEDIWTHLREWPEREQVHAAFQLDGYSSEDRTELAERWAETPDAELQSLIIDSAEQGYYTRTVKLEPETREQIGDAAVDKNTKVRDLLPMIIRKWLRENGYCRDGTNGSLSDFGSEGSQ